MSLWRQASSFFVVFLLTLFFINYFINVGTEIRSRISPRLWYFDQLTVKPSNRLTPWVFKNPKKKIKFKN